MEEVVVAAGGAAEMEVEAAEAGANGVLVAVETALGEVSYRVLFALDGLMGLW